MDLICLHIVILYSLQSRYDNIYVYDCFLNVKFNNDYYLSIILNFYISFLIEKFNIL